MIAVRHQTRRRCPRIESSSTKVYIYTGWARPYLSSDVSRAHIHKLLLSPDHAQCICELPTHAKSNADFRARRRRSVLTCDVSSRKRGCATPRGVSDTPEVIHLSSLLSLGLLKVSWPGVRKSRCMRRVSPLFTSLFSRGAAAARAY